MLLSDILEHLIRMDHTQAKLNFVCMPTCSPSFSYCDRRTCSSSGFNGLSGISADSVARARNDREKFERTFLHQQHLKEPSWSVKLCEDEKSRCTQHNGYKVPYLRMFRYPYLHGS